MKDCMEVDQKKKLEEQLRKLMAQAEQPQEEKTAPKRTGNIRVIRRRRGEPDMVIA